MRQCLKKNKKSLVWYTFQEQQYIYEAAKKHRIPWSVCYATFSLTLTGVGDESCTHSAQLDLQIIVDSSASVGLEHFQTMMKVCTLAQMYIYPYNLSACMSGCLAVWLSGCLAVWRSGCLAIWLLGYK